MYRKRIEYLAAGILLVICFCCGCGSTDNLSISKDGFSLDTVITITLYGTDDESLLDEGFALCGYYEKLLSPTIEGSDIYRINHNKGPVSVDAVTAFLLSEGIKYYEQSGGLFDISIGTVSELWDFTSGSAQIPDKEEISNAVSKVDASAIEVSGCTVTVPEGMKLDLGGIAKGYIAQKLAAFYSAKGVSSALLNLGGNVVCIGTPPDRDAFKIGIKKPFSDGETIKNVEIDNKCVVTSGVYERFFYKDDILFHHILDPERGYPCDTDLYSVTVIGDDSMEADAFSTICLMLGREKAETFARERPDVRFIFVTDTYEVIEIN